MDFPAAQAAGGPADQPGGAPSGSPRSATRPSKGQALFLVFVGGALGVLLSSLLRTALSPTLSAPLALALVNVFGAFALGMLVGRIPDGGNGSRLLWGTGFLGGFTSFSAISASTIPVLEMVGYYDESSMRGLHALNMPIFAIALAFISLAVGMVAAMWGFRLTSGRGARPEETVRNRGGQNQTAPNRGGQNPNPQNRSAQNQGEGQ